MTAHPTRREFLSTTGKALSGAALASALAARQSRAAADDPIRIGMIGCGGIMNLHARGIASRGSNVVVTHLCDVDPAHIDGIAKHLASFQQHAPGRTARYEDVLDDRSVDAVIIATPHHWHAPITLRALQAGKDVYIEKPLSHVFAEGPLVIEAAQKYGRIVQHGSQMRSSPVTAEAGKVLAQGILGEVKVAKAWNVQDRGVNPKVADSDPPAGVDYDRWLGPAPKRPFNKNRFHGNWRVFRDYGNGDMGDDGIHDIDLARWGLGADQLPSRITAHGSTVHLRGDRDYPDNMLVTWQYPDDKVLIYEDRLFTPYGMHGFDSGNAFYGTEGYMIFSRRGYYQVYLGPKEEKGPGVSAAIRGNAGRGYDEHMENFFDCVRTRKSPVATPEVAHLSCALVHLGEIAYRTQSVLEFDATAGRFINHEAANAMLTKDYRAPYGLPPV